MKKGICIVLLIVIAFTGCTKKGTCEACGQENVKLQSYDYFGENIDLCETCYGVLSMLASFGG